MNKFCEPINLFNNKIRNQKTNALTILPIFFYNQFKLFFNMFFLLITISQFFEPLRVGLLITYVSPLALVLSLSLAKEIYDEVKRAIKDKQYNSEEYT
jgi:phospholipid-translocating ATPase